MIIAPKKANMQKRYESKPAKIPVVNNGLKFDG